MQISWDAVGLPGKKGGNKSNHSLSPIYQYYYLNIYISVKVKFLGQNQDKDAPTMETKQYDEMHE